jgi:hypothetical protein
MGEGEHSYGQNGQRLAHIEVEEVKPNVGAAFCSGAVRLDEVRAL